MVASGVITVGNAIPIVMGANIGTTVTNTLVSLGHFTRREEFKRAVSGATVHDFFNLICVSILFPLELTTGFLKKLATQMSVMFAQFGWIKFTSPLKLATKPAINLIKDLFVKYLNLPHGDTYILILFVSIILLFLSFLCFLSLS